MNEHSISLVNAADVDELLPLMRSYCAFYEVSVSDDALRRLARALVDAPEQAGVQLIARDSNGRGVGFATVYWSWSTINACRIGVMNDLYVAESARGQGLAEALVQQCRLACVRRGARRLVWQTAPGNRRARAVYDRIGATAETWVEYSLDVGPGDAA